MIRRRFLALLGVFGAQKASSGVAGVPGLTEEFARKLLEFDKHWDEFKRRIAGCDLKKDLLEATDCSAHRRELNVKVFERAGKAAHKLWPPEEDKCATKSGE